MAVKKSIEEKVPVVKGPKVKSKMDLMKEAMAKINTKFGANTIGTLTTKKDDFRIEVIATRSATYNATIGGGFKKGGISEIYGPPDSGKTSIMLDTIGYNMQINPDFTAGWFETEGHFDIDYAVKTFGIDPERFSIWEMSDFGAEKGLDILESFLRSSTLDIMIINTIAGLTPLVELEASMEKQHMALQARMMSKLMRKITAIAAKTKTHVGCVNQVRSDIGNTGPMGAPAVTPGGAALKFYSSQRIQQKNGFMKAEDKIKGYDPDIFKKIDVQTKKNRLSTGQNPYKKCTYYVEYGVGIDTLGELPGLVVDYGILTKAGSWFKDLDKDGLVIERKGTKLVWSSKTTFRDYLKDNPDYVEELRNRITKAGIKVPDVESMSDEEIALIEKENLEAESYLQEMGVDTSEAVE